jgi:hypothetical protein
MFYFFLPDYRYRDKCMWRYTNDSKSEQLRRSIGLNTADHGLINYIDTKAKFLHLVKKKWTYKGTLRQVWIRIHRLGYSQSYWFFRPIFVNCCPSNLLSSSTPPPLPVWISILFTRIQCVRVGGLWGSGPQTDKHLPQSHFTCQFIYMTTLHCPL